MFAAYPGDGADAESPVIEVVVEGLPRAGEQLREQGVDVRLIFEAEEVKDWEGLEGRCLFGRDRCQGLDEIAVQSRARYPVVESLSPHYYAM